MPLARYWTFIAVASLLIGPLLMSVGDLFHPEERLDAAEQAAIIVNHPARWYAAHLMLFFGMLLFIPGLLAISELHAQRARRLGLSTRILLMIGAAAFAAIFTLEMLLGRYASDGADVSETTALIETVGSGWMLGAVVLGGIPFFVAVALFSGHMIVANDGLRWPAVLIALGVICIVIEIISAQVLMSQIGNILVLVGSTWIAWRIATATEQLARPEA